MQIIDMKDLEDGGAIMTVDLTAEEIVLFAKEGIMSVLTRSAEQIAKQHDPIPKEDTELELALDNAFLQEELENKEKEIENLYIYKKAIMKMCSHRQKEIDDYIRIAKQAVYDDEMDNYKRYRKMDTRIKPDYDMEVEDEL